MEGVTTAIVLALFAGLVWPHMVKNRPQYHMALAAVLLVILLSALEAMIDSRGFDRFAILIIALLQVFAILAIVLSASGKRPGELAGEVGETIEVIRRGEEEKEIIIPVRGETPKPRRGGRDEDDEPRERIELRTEELEGAPDLRRPTAPPAPRADDRNKPVPLE